MTGKKRGRPKTGTKSYLGVKVEPGLLQKLKAKAKAEGTTVTQVTEGALKGLLEKTLSGSLTRGNARRLLRSLPSPEEVAREPKGSLIFFNVEKRDVLVMPRTDVPELRAWLETKALPGEKKPLELVGR